MAVILFETVIKDLVLEAHPLLSEKDIEQYKKLLKLFPKNPLYNIELLLFGKGEHEELMYFILTKNGNPTVLMPFFYRKITIAGKETDYYDVSSPYGYSGPIYTKNTEKKLTAQFWGKVDKWYKKNNVVSEFIRFNMQENWKDYTGEINPTLSNVRGKILPEEEQWNNFKPKVRNNYRKSVKCGLKSVIYHKNITLEAIRQFHTIYTATMERKKASPLYFYKMDYFVNLIENNVSSSAIVIIYKDGIPISTELLLLSDTTVNSFLGGTDINYFDTRPNDFLKIEVLNWAREKGYTYYLLGGGRENNDSLYHYKKDFFPTEEDTIFYTGRKIINEVNYHNLVSANPYCVGCTVGNYFPLYRCKTTC